ncbi:MAG: hypothetical protein AB2L14_12825 [Candidatus Xenobiia bacterium LiM19]
MKHPVFFIALFLVLLTCQAYSDTFENGPAGMRVDYTITGLSLSAPEDTKSLVREGSGNVYIRDYQVKYKTKAGRITFSGRISDSNASSELAEYLEVYLACINKDEPWGKTSDLPRLEQNGLARTCFITAPSQSGSFSLSLDVPPGYKVCFMMYLFRSPNDYETTNFDKSLYNETPLNSHRSSFGSNVLAIYGISSDAPEWTTVVEPPDIGGYVLTAALAAAVAAIVAAAAIAGAAVKTGGKKPDDKPLAYILQLSADTVKLNPEKPASLRITAWKVNSETKSCVRAPEASLTVLVSPDAKGLIVAPLAGKEDLTVSLSIDRQAIITETELTVTAQAGVSSTSAAVKVIVEQGIEMEFF